MTIEWVTDLFYCESWDTIQRTQEVSKSQVAYPTGDQMIHSYGLHWAIERVDWGKPGNGNFGTLLGAATRSKKAKPVDFRTQRGIYVLYADYELVYVGQTGAGRDRLFKRLKQHRNDHLSERWNRFSWFGTQWVTKKHELSEDTAKVSQTVEEALNTLESVSIAISEPKLNLQRGRWGKTKKYFQYWERTEGEFEEEVDKD